MKKPELEQLRKDINAMIDAIINTNDLKAMADSGNQVGVIYNGDTDTWAEIIPQDKGAVLIEEAKKRGFKKGVVISKEGINKKFSIEFRPIKESEFIYFPDVDILDSLSGHIYEKGQWATIIKEPIIIDGKEVDVSPTGCTIKGVAFHKYQIKTLQSLNPIFTEILKRMEEKNG